MGLKVTEVYDNTLIALEDVPVYNYPNGTRIGTITKGNSTNRVYAHVDRPNQVWFMFDYTIPGNTPGAYFVLDKKGRFRINRGPGVGKIDVATLTSVDVFPKDSQIKTFALYGIIGVLALLLLKK